MKKLIFILVLMLFLVTNFQIAQAKGNQGVEILIEYQSEKVIDKTKPAPIIALNIMPIFDKLTSGKYEVKDFTKENLPNATKEMSVEQNKITINGVAFGPEIQLDESQANQIIAYLYRFNQDYFYLLEDYSFPPKENRAIRLSKNSFKFNFSNTYRLMIYNLETNESQFIFSDKSQQLKFSVKSFTSQIASISLSDTRKIESIDGSLAYSVGLTERFSYQIKLKIPETIEEASQITCDFYPDEPIVIESSDVPLNKVAFSPIYPLNSLNFDSEKRYLPVKESLYAYCLDLEEFIKTHLGQEVTIKINCYIPSSKLINDITFVNNLSDNPNLYFHSKSQNYSARLRYTGDTANSGEYLFPDVKILKANFITVDANSNLPLSASKYLLGRIGKNHQIEFYQGSNQNGEISYKVIDGLNLKLKNNSYNFGENYQKINQIYQSGQLADCLKIESAKQLIMSNNELAPFSFEKVETQQIKYVDYSKLTASLMSIVGLVNDEKYFLYQVESPDGYPLEQAITAFTVDGKNNLLAPLDNPLATSQIPDNYLKNGYNVLYNSKDGKKVSQFNLISYFALMFICVFVVFALIATILIRLDFRQK